MVTEHYCLFMATWSIYVLTRCWLLLELWSSLVHNVLTHYSTGCGAGAGWTAQQRLAVAHVCSTEYSARCNISTVYWSVYYVIMSGDKQKNYPGHEWPFCFYTTSQLKYPFILVHAIQIFNGPSWKKIGLYVPYKMTLMSFTLVIHGRFVCRIDAKYVSPPRFPGTF